MIYHDQVTISGASGTGYMRGGSGLMEYMAVTYTNGAATTDVAVTDEATATAILTLTDANTNILAPVRRQAVSNVGGAIAGEYARQPITGRIKVDVAQNNANGTVVVDAWWSDA